MIEQRSAAAAAVAENRTRGGARAACQGPLKQRDVERFDDDEDLDDVWN